MSKIIAFIIVSLLYLYSTKKELEVISLFRSESSGHDIYHPRRVVDTAVRFQKEEGGNRLIIVVAATGENFILQ